MFVFICLGGGEALDWFKRELGKEYPVKQRGRLGGGPEGDKVVKVLNRSVGWREEEGIVVEADAA